MSNRRTVETWKEAKKRCRLNGADIHMAKELGMTPKTLIKNIPTQDQKWKAPVKLWISDLYENKFGKVLTVEPALVTTKKQTEEESMSFVDWGDLPFEKV